MNCLNGLGRGGGPGTSGGRGQWTAGNPMGTVFQEAMPIGCGSPWLSTWPHCLDTDTEGAGRGCTLACLQAPPSAGLFLLFA